MQGKPYFCNICSYAKDGCSFHEWCQSSNAQRVIGRYTSRLFIPTILRIPRTSKIVKNILFSHILSFPSGAANSAETLPCFKLFLELSNKGSLKLTTINHSQHAFHWTAIALFGQDYVLGSSSYKKAKTSLVALLKLLHERMKILLILMTSEKYFYPLMTWFKQERLISIINILRIERVVVTQD